MLKNVFGMEHVLEDKICRFICDHSTSIDHIKEALFQFQKTIGQVEDKAKAEQAAKLATTPEAPQPIAQTAVEVPLTQEETNEHQ